MTYSSLENIQDSKGHVFYRFFWKISSLMISILILNCSLQTERFRRPKSLRQLPGQRPGPTKGDRGTTWGEAYWRGTPFLDSKQSWELLDDFQSFVKNPLVNFIPKRVEGVLVAVVYHATLCLRTWLARSLTQRLKTAWPLRLGGWDGAQRRSSSKFRDSRSYWGSHSQYWEGQSGNDFDCTWCHVRVPCLDGVQCCQYC